MIEDLTPRQVWEALMSNPAAALCDVRTNAEWSFVGIPDLTQTGKQPVLVQWQIFPTMQPNPKFVEALGHGNLQHSDHLYFICRSGSRSMAAAQAAAVEFAENLASKIKRDIVPSQLVAALSVPGVYEVVLASPAFIALADGQWTNCTAINLTQVIGTEHS